MSSSSLIAAAPSNSLGFVDFLGIFPLLQKQLIESIAADQYEKTKVILNSGIDVNFQDEDGFTPLHHAVITDKTYVSLLLDHGAQPEQFTGKTISPLLLACVVGAVGAAKILAEKIPAYRQTLAEPDGPIQLAVNNQNRLLAKELIALVEQPESKFNYNELHQAAEWHQLEKIAQISPIEPKLNQKDIFGYTPLHLAVLNNDPLMVSALIAKGAEPIALTAQGASAFDLANQHGYAEVLTALKAPQQAVDITAEQLNSLLHQHYLTHFIHHPNNKKTLGTLLTENHFNTTLKNINFDEISPFYLKFVDLKGIEFDHCIFHQGFEKVHFQATFNDCIFRAFECQGCFFEPGTLIQNSTIQDSFFGHNFFDRTFFLNNSFFHSGFDFSQFNAVTFNKNYFYNNQFWNVSFNSWLIETNSAILASDFKMADTKKIISNRDKPLIGIFGEWAELEDFSKPGFLAAEPFARIKQADTLPLLLSRENLVKKVNADLLASEVKEIIEKINPLELKESIIQTILHTDSKSIQMVNDLAASYAQRLDGLWIPGGPDIEASFYGKPTSEDFYNNQYYAYQLFEFALVDQMLKLEKPILGICHGAQLINVYFGGTLLAHVDGHNGVIQPLEVLQDQGRIGESIEGKQVWGLSMHHQAIDMLAPSLEIVATYDGVIKAAQGKTQPVWLFQFHPEYLLDNNNVQMLDSFFAATKNLPAKLSNTPLTLQDVLIASYQELAFEEVTSPLTMTSAVSGNDSISPANSQLFINPLPEALQTSALLLEV